MIALLFALAGPLDAPVDQKPTVRSEIVRGYEAGKACEGVPSVLRVETCITQVRDRYRLSNPNTAAYEIGLAYAKWAAVDLLYQAFSELPGNGAAASQLELARLTAQVGTVDVEVQARKLGLGLNDVFEAIGAPARARAERWKLDHVK